MGRLTYAKTLKIMICSLSVCVGGGGGGGGATNFISVG